MFSHLVLSIIPCKTNKHFYWRNANRFARNCEENITSNLKDIILIRSANEPWIVFILKVSYFVSVYEELWYQWLLALSTINQRVASRVSKVSIRIFLTANIFEFFQGISSVYHSQGSLFFLCPACNVWSSPSTAVEQPECFTFPTWG